MHNVSTVVNGNKLVITIDISKETIKQAPPSSTGRTKLVASTAGAMPIANTGASLSLALNLMAK